MVFFNSIEADNTEGGHGLPGEERSASGCEGWVLQELSPSHGEGPDCHSPVTQVMCTTRLFQFGLLFLTSRFGSKYVCPNVMELL